MIIKTKFGFCEYDFEQDYVHIYNLYVYPNYRRQGKGKKILKLAITTIRKKKYKGEIQIVAIPKEYSISLNNLTIFYKNMGLEVYEYYG